MIILRGRDGVLRAFYNVCRHRGARLIEDGDGNVGRFIRCPYHRWAYDLDGRCVGTPLFTGSDIPADQCAIFATDHAAAFDRRDHGLLSVAVATFGPVVLVNLDSEPEPLAVHLDDLSERLAGYRLDEWRLAHTAHYRVAANYNFWDTVNREDVAIVERVQRGLATTPFPGGPMCYRFEEPVHRFQSTLADRMIGVRRVPTGDAPGSPKVALDAAARITRTSGPPPSTARRPVRPSRNTTPGC